MSTIESRRGRRRLEALDIDSELAAGCSEAEDARAALGPATSASEVWYVNTRHPHCCHEFGPVEPGKYAMSVRRCWKCRAVATISQTAG